MLQVENTVNLFCEVRGPAQELQAACDKLSAFTRTLDKANDIGCPVFEVEDTAAGPVLYVLGGFLDFLVNEQCIAPPEAPESNGLLITADRLVDAELLRPYQAEVATTGLLTPFKRGLLNVAVGGGKTRLAYAIMSLGATLGKMRWLYLVHNKELANQSMVAFAELETAFGAFCTKPKITASTYSQIKRLPSTCFDGVIVDEAHALPATNRALAYGAIKAEYRLGMSGSPLDRCDNKNAFVIGLTGPEIATLNVDDLSRQGFLSKGHIQVMPFIH
jgi:superfamily II DNA or RNA helicase